jgi:hypothetical protein
MRGKERTRETGFFLAENFCHFTNKKNWTANYPKDLSWEKRHPKLPYFKEKQVELAVFTQ